MQVTECIIISQNDNKIILLLIGGDKSTQFKDIEKAKRILKGLDDG